MISQQNHVFIDPKECGSGIGYYINLTDWTDRKTGGTTYDMNGTVVLTDCNHKIDWGFGEDSLDKIDAAIAMLREFRKKCVEAKKTLAQLRAK